MKRAFWFDLLWLTLLIGFFYALFLGSYPLFTPDGARYCEIPREMLALKDFITPHLNYVIYFEKPPLFYWLQTFSMHFFGMNEWSLRFWDSAFGVIGCIITYIAGFHLYNRKTGILSALILGTSFIYFIMAHAISLDMSVSTLMAITVFSFLLSTKTKSIKKRNLLIYNAALFSALAILTKGLIGILFPIIIVSLWILLLNQWKVLKNWHLLSAFLILLLITIPWHILVQLRNPSFFNYYFINQQFARFSTDVAHRTAPWFFFIPVLLFGIFPWTFFLFQSIKKIWPRWKVRHQHHTEIFLLIWIIFVFLFFSFSHSKLIPYIIPIFPPLALFIGHYFAEHLKVPSRGLRIGSLLFFIFMIALDIAFIAALYTHHADQLVPLKHYLIALLIALTTTAMLFFVLLKEKAPLAFILLIFGIFTAYMILLCAIPTFNTRSIKPLAMVINQQLKPSDEIIAYDHYYQDLPFYTKSRITVVNWKNELEFGMKHQNTKKWMINEKTFWHRLKKMNHRIFIVVRKKYSDLFMHHTHPKLYLLAKTKSNLLFSNQKEVNT